MGRPKGSTNKVEQTLGVESTKTEEQPKQVETNVVVANTAPPVDQVLERGGAFLANVDGKDEFWSRSMLDIAFKRGSHTIEMPKGSSYIPPVNAKCENCG